MFIAVSESSASVRDVLTAGMIYIYSTRTHTLSNHGGRCLLSSCGRHVVAPLPAAPEPDHTAIGKHTTTCAILHQ